jgi:GNAT superfamily N-acetyltransferase
VPALDCTWRLKRVDDVPVWSISCFYVRKSFRRRGITSELIAAAIDAAERARAPALEAYPLDRDKTPSATSTGIVSTFSRAGFKEVARHVPPRPIMRFDLKSLCFHNNH